MNIFIIWHISGHGRDVLHTFNLEYTWLKPGNVNANVDYTKNPDTADNILLHSLNKTVGQVIVKERVVLHRLIVRFKIA